MITSAIVYYLKDNNTRAGAKILGELTGAQVVELKEMKKGNFIQALAKKGTKLIGDPWSEIKSAESIYLMSPIWASNGVPAMNAFLDKADFTNKKIIIITFQQFSDLRNSSNVHTYFRSKVEEKEGNVISCHALLGGTMGHFAGEDHIRKQIETLMGNLHW